LPSTHVQAVEGEVLVVNWVPGISHHAGLDLVLFVGQQLQFDIGVSGRLGASVHAGGDVPGSSGSSLAGQSATTDDGDHQGVPFGQVAQLEVDGTQLSVLVSNGQLLPVGQCMVVQGTPLWSGAPAWSWIPRISRSVATTSSRLSPIFWVKPKPLYSCTMH